MELPTSPRRCLAIAMLRAVGVDQKDTARYVRCANQTVVDVDKWFREEDYHRVARICDDQSIKKMVAAEVIYWGLEQEIVVKLDRLTQDDILRHYRHDYHETIDFSSPSFQKHTSAVLRLLDTYAGQLAVTYEPEDFIAPQRKERPDDKEFAFFHYAKDVVPSLDTLIDDQIDREDISVVAEVEMEPLFAALIGHYDGTTLWEKIKSYKQARDAYVATGLKLHKIIMTEVCAFSLQVPKETEIFLGGLRSLVQTELAPIRVKLNLEGIETDRGAVLEKLPDTSGQAFRQFLEFVNRYKNKVKDGHRNDMHEASDNVGKVILKLVDRLKENYETMKRLYKVIVTGVGEEKLKVMLPDGTKCKFCPLP